MKATQQRDFYAGLLMLAIGLGSTYVATRYDMGTATKMGSGYFPFVLSVILALLGLAMAVGARAPAREAADGLEPLPSHGLSSGKRTGADWRGWGAISLAVLLFIGLAQHGGLAPATFACVFVAALGDRANTWKGAFLLAVGVTVFAVALFAYGLRVQIPIFGSL